MSISDRKDGRYSFGYFCDECGDKSRLNGLIRRWHCHHCNQDYCFNCRDEWSPFFQPATNFPTGRLVASSPIAEHNQTQLSLSWHPRADEIYHLWYKMERARGTNVLSVDNLLIYTVIHDSEKRGLANAFRCLYPSPDINLCPSLLQAVSRSLLGQVKRKEKTDPSLTNFLEAHGLREDVESLAALENMAGIVLKNRLLGVAYDEQLNGIPVCSFPIENEKGNSTNAFRRFLNEGGLLHDAFPNKEFFLDSLQAVTRCLIGQIKRKEKPDLILSHFLEAYGLSAEEGSLVALENLSRLLKDHILPDVQKDVGETEDEEGIVGEYWEHEMLPA
jgi:hypothetical protein